MCVCGMCVVCVCGLCVCVCVWYVCGVCVWTVCVCVCVCRDRACHTIACLIYSSSPTHSFQLTCAPKTSSMTNLLLVSQIGTLRFVT